MIAVADVSEALALLRPLLREPGSESVLALAAEGRVLAAPLRAAEAVPAWPRAAMDGFAAICADLDGVSPEHPIDLTLVGEAAPGRPFRRRLQPGQAVGIATGAPMPEGAECVVPWEHTREPVGGRVRILRPAPRGRHVSRPGEDVAAGDTTLPAGTVLGPLEMGLLALLGEMRVRVYTRPRVTILCTGDELVEPHCSPAFGQIRNVNGPALVALVRQAGGVPVYLGTCPDDPAIIARRLADGPESDLYLTTGGVSGGVPDRVVEAAGRNGARVLFDRLLQKPGAACLGAVYHDRPWLGLSGNPAAAITQFDFLVRPLLAQTAGRTDVLLQGTWARLVHALDKRSPVRRYLRAQAAWDGLELKADTALAQQSTVLSSMSLAHGYVELPPGAQPGAGTVVRLWLRPGLLPAPALYPAEWTPTVD